LKVFYAHVKEAGAAFMLLTCFFGKLRSERMKNQSGFTMIELVVVIVVLGILAAVAIPKYVDLSDEALEASQAGMSGAVKSTHSILIAQRAVAGETEIYPTVTQIVAGMTGESVTAVGTGVQVVINGSDHVVPTYIKDDCSTPTTNVDDVVLCVGSI
jgi:MSHA pilin protein MshA